MNAARDLQDAIALMAQGMKHDATLSLALAAAWLDPLWFFSTGADPLYELVGHEADRYEQARFALSVARECSPRLYAELIRGLRSGWTFNEFEQAFYAGFAREYPGIPLGTIDDMIYGVPIDFSGLDVLDPNFTREHPDLAAMLDRCFDVRPVPECYRWHVEPYASINEEDLDAASVLAAPVIRSLIREDCQPYADLALMLLYLFSRTNNTLLDYTANDYWEEGYESLTWQREHLELVEEAAREARVVLAATDRALAVLQARPDVAAALRNNIAACKAALERKQPHDTLALDWPTRGRTRRARQGARRGTGPGVSLSLVRHSYAQGD